MNQLTNKTWVLEYHNGLRFYLDEDQKNFFMQSLNSGAKQVDIDGMVLTGGFAFLVEASKLEEADNKKLGNWKCGLGHWHAKDERCSHKYAGREQKEVSPEQLRKNKVRLEVMRHKYLLKIKVPGDLEKLAEGVGLDVEKI